jgi:hypothetical protein
MPCSLTESAVKQTDMPYRLALDTTDFPFQWLVGVLFQKVMQMQHEDDHSPPLNAEVKHAWSISPLPDMSSWRCV